jgi:hypothetical protein
MIEIYLTGEDLDCLGWHRADDDEWSERAEAMMNALIASAPKQHRVRRPSLETELKPRDAPAAAPPPAGWPRFLRAADLAGAVFPVSEAVILQEARKAGVGRKMGRAIVFSSDDIKQLYEALSPCRSSSSPAPSRLTGSSGGASAASALKRVRKLLTDAAPKRSAPSARANFSKKPSTVVVPLAPSHKRH